MTDARLPSDWLGRMDYDDLSDTAWRVFTGALMWSNRHGTDGRIPKRYLKALHPDGEKPAAADELECKGVWSSNTTDYLLPEWSKKLGQSTAAEVASNKEKARLRQQKHRATKKAAETPSDTPSPHPRVTPHVTRDVARDVGQDRTGQEGQDRPRSTAGSSAARGDAEQPVTDWPTVSPGRGERGECPVCGGRTYSGYCERQDEPEHLAYEAAHAF